MILLRTSGRGCRVQAAQGLRKQVFPDQARLVWELVHQHMAAHHSTHSYTRYAQTSSPLSSMYVVPSTYAISRPV